MLHHIALSLLRGLTQPQCVDLLRNINHPRALFEDTATVLDTLDQLVPATRTQLLHLFAERGEEALSRAADELEFCRRHNIRPLAHDRHDVARIEIGRAAIVDDGGGVGAFGQSLRATSWRSWARAASPPTAKSTANAAAPNWPKPSPIPSS